MEITTKFNIGDKVWVYLSNQNKYTWFEVMQMRIQVNQLGNPAVDYEVKNRFYSRTEYMHDADSFASAFSFNYSEDEVFTSPEELKKWRNNKHLESMEDMTELKKTSEYLFGWMTRTSV